MNDYVRGIPMIFRLQEEEEEVFGVAEFPFDQIGTCASVQDIPRYNFDLERKVKADIVSFRDEMEVRTMHQMHQRRPVLIQRNNTSAANGTDAAVAVGAKSPPSMFKAKSTPLAALAGLGARLSGSLHVFDTDNQPSPTIVHFNTDALSPDSDRLSTGGGGSGGRPKATSDASIIDPDTIRSRLPPLKRREEPKPMGTRIKGLFRSKTRTPQNA
ncbi:hypothetical protein LPJ72_002285 [Coemansia sp. Benny D160-2]|nr:hypothetical protein LPJ72_002285 [Coemansia sp. Benny D160-2]